MDYIKLVHWHSGQRTAMTEYECTQILGPTACLPTVMA